MVFAHSTLPRIGRTITRVKNKVRDYFVTNYRVYNSSDVSFCNHFEVLNRKAHYGHISTDYIGGVTYLYDVGVHGKDI